MGLFGKKKQVLSPRQEETPMGILFECFILSTIDRLPKDRHEQLNAMNLAKVFNLESKDWKLVIKQVLHLSATIETAILDLWYKNQELASQQNIEYQPNQFAKDFITNFYKADSRIDIWDDNSLSQAKERIKRNQTPRL